MALLRKNVMMSDDDQKTALKKARPYLTKQKNKAPSISEAIRWCIANAPSPETLKTQKA